MTLEEIEVCLNKIKKGENVIFQIFRNSEEFLDGKYDEIKLEISFDDIIFQLNQIKSEIFWDGAAGAGSTFSDEETSQMTEENLRQFLSQLFVNKNQTVCIID
jgi:hypothetical protein